MSSYYKRTSAPIVAWSSNTLPLLGKYERQTNNPTNQHKTRKLIYHVSVAYGYSLPAFEGWLRQAELHTLLTRVDLCARPDLKQTNNKAPKWERDLCIDHTLSTYLIL